MSQSAMEKRQRMSVYFAPLEGITGYVYRNVHHRLFGGIEKYFMPFLTPHTKRSFNAKERNDILPEHNEGEGVRAVPQILTNQAADFLTVARELAGYGYREVNLNLGCPSKTVTGKGRGAGFLRVPKELDRFLDQVFSAPDLKLKVSIKTRAGVKEPEELIRLLELYNQYPVSELIIHPRVQQDYYKNKPNWQVYREAVRVSRHPLCYNGDIFDYEDFKRLSSEVGQPDCIMLGRGLVANPALAEEFCGKGIRLNRKRLRSFHDQLCQAYQGVMSGDAPVLYKMKELWFYMSHMFTQGERYYKKIRKSRSLTEYGQAVNALFQEQEILQQGRFCPP